MGTDWARAIARGHIALYFGNVESEEFSRPATGHPGGSQAARSSWSREQWLAIASPHRYQLLHLVASIGRTTVQELADLTGRSPQSIYPHLQSLANAGFLVAAAGNDGSSQTRGRAYLPGPALLVSPFDPETGNGSSRMAQLGAMMLHDATARLVRHGETSEGVPVGRGKAARQSMLASVTWLDESRRTRLNELYAAIAELVEQGRIARTGERVNVVAYHFPDVTLRESRHQRKKDGPTRRRRGTRPEFGG